MNTWVPQGVGERLVANMRLRTKDADNRIHTRPVSDYTDEGRYARELEILFRRYPIVVAHSSQLSKAGDFITHSTLGVPLLVARQSDGSVAAFLNICRHRSAIVESADCGHRTSFNCPYHQWSYGADGALVRIPDEASFAGIDKSALGLRPVAAAEKHGLIFVRLAEGPPIDLDTYLGALGPELHDIGVAKHVFYQQRNTPVKCNWKVLMEGSLESYHFNFLHVNTAGNQFQAMSAIFDSWPPHQRFILPKRNIVEHAERGANLRSRMLPNYFIFPNTMLTMPHDHMMITQAYPDGVGACVFYNSLLTLEAPASVDATAYWERALDLTESVNREDFVVIEGIQRAYRNAGGERVIHGGFERGLTRFHEACDQALAQPAG